MNFILKMLVAKYGKDVAKKMYNEYKKNKRSKNLSAKRKRGQEWTVGD